MVGRSAARRVPVEQLRDRSRLPGLHPDGGRIAGAGQGARPQHGVMAARHPLGNQSAHVGVQRGRSKSGVRASDCHWRIRCAVHFHQ